MSVFPHRAMAVVTVAVLALSGCAAAGDFGAPGTTGPDPIAFPECKDTSYDFVGRGTLAGLGLDTATPVEPPTPHQPAMIWVTHNLKPWGHGEPGGPVDMTRMLCFEFADGSGGSEWPVDAAWQPPGSHVIPALERDAADRMNAILSTRTQARPRGT